MLLHTVDRLKIEGINVTLLQNSRNFYLTYPQLADVVKQNYPMLSDILGELTALRAEEWLKKEWFYGFDGDCVWLTR